MPTPSSDQPPQAPSPHVFSTCPDDSQLSPRPGWNLDQHGATHEDHDVNMEVRDDSDSPPVGEVINVRDGAVIPDAVVREGISAESSSRATTMSPRPQSHGTIITSPTSSDIERDAPKASGLLEDGLSRSTELKPSEAPPSQNRARVSSEYPHETDSSSADEDEDEDSYSLSMGSDYPTRRTRPTLPSSFLRPGSRFHGTQQSERQVYDVQVEIKHVDMHESFLCGYLRIQGLTEDHPTLTTYFEGEIIGSKHNFFTQHDDWGANHKVDLSHWSKFSAFRPYQKHARRGPVAISDVAQRENIFMRWKEHFLVPDHRVRTITGASFEGFYYICFNQIRGEVSGIYFHSKSEKFQQLELRHVPDRGCFNAVEFR